MQSVVRAFTLLEMIAEADGVTGLAELSKLSGMAPTTIYRLMRTMVELGYARQVSSRQDLLGPWPRSAPAPRRFWVFGRGLRCATSWTMSGRAPISRFWRATRWCTSRRRPVDTR